MSRVDLGLPSLREVDPDLPREWLEFTDPADPGHLVRADLTWLTSAWTCVYGRGCPGVVEGRPDDGCCSHGAFVVDEADAARVDRYAARLRAKDWQYAALGRAEGVWEDDDLDDEPARRTRVVDGACVFLNRAGWPAGSGCALHALALRLGKHPLETKPDVCWQLPVRREPLDVTRADDVAVRVTALGEFDRRGWGPGGEDLQWWCTGSPAAHVGAEPLWVSYRAELVALVGQPAYDELARLVALRGGAGLVHPATAAARSGTAPPD